MFTSLVGTIFFLQSFPFDQATTQSAIIWLCLGMKYIIITCSYSYMEIQQSNKRVVFDLFVQRSYPSQKCKRLAAFFFLSSTCVSYEILTHCSFVMQVDIVFTPQNVQNDKIVPVQITIQVIGLWPHLSVIWK